MSNISSSLFRGPRGYFETSGATAKTEVDTVACGHCGGQIFCCDPVTKSPKKPEDIGGVCNSCRAPICPKCVERDFCMPLQEALMVIEGHSRVPRDLQERVRRDVFGMK